MDEGTKRRKPVELWYVKVILVLGPVLISAYFSYCNAKLEATSSARRMSGKVEEKAEAGYAEILNALKHLDEESRAIRVYLGKLEHRIELLEHPSFRMRIPDAGSGAAGSAAAGSGEITWEVVSPVPEPLEIAPNLDVAKARAQQLDHKLKEQ